jgi:hypothetical protein
MAIKHDIDIEDSIKTFIENSIFLKEYESTDGIINNAAHNYNTAKKVAGQISKSVKQLLASEDGTTEFIKLLEHKNLVVAASAAEYLYPLYPEKCLKILKKYSKSLKNKLDSYKIDCKIEGFIQKQPFFMKSFSNLYNSEDLDSLNRENDI